MKQYGSLPADVLDPRCLFTKIYNQEVLISKGRKDEMKTEIMFDRGDPLK